MGMVVGASLKFPSLTFFSFFSYRNGHFLLLSGVRPETRRLLVAHGVLPKQNPAAYMQHQMTTPGHTRRYSTADDEDDTMPLLDDSTAEAERANRIMTAPTMDEALAWCEDDILQAELGADANGVLSTAISYNSIEGKLWSDDVVECCIVTANFFSPPPHLLSPRHPRRLSDLRRRLDAQRPQTAAGGDHAVL